MASLNFDASKYASANTQTLDYSHWAPGKTSVVIVSASTGMGATSGNPHYRLEVQALDGPNLGRRHPIYLVRKHHNPDVVNYSKRDLANIVFATGLKGFDDIGELNGKRLTIDVGRRVNKKGESVSTFSKFSPYEENKPSTYDPNVSAYGKVKEGAHITSYKPSANPGGSFVDDATIF